MEELRNIIKEIQGYKLKGVTDTTILEVSSNLFMHLNKMKTQQGEKKDWKNEKASEKQIAFLKKNNYKGAMDITKLEASKLIDEVIKRGKEELMDY